jgi:NADPH:quinone reductase-like Zn-dependent oxidoreductase
MMKAVVVVHPGTEHPLELREVPVPEPGHAEVLVKVKAASLNHRDTYAYGNRPRKENSTFQPIIVGADGAGEVAKVGECVRGWHEGAAVVINPELFCGECEFCRAGAQALCVKGQTLGVPGHGTFAEYVKVLAVNLVRKPDSLSFEQAAALPVALGSAWRALVTVGDLHHGDTILIHGIGGGVALFALQIATAFGARAIVTSSSAAKLERALAMGAAAGINYRNEDVAARVLEVTGGRGADVVLDSGGKETLPISLKAVRKNGRILSMGATTGFESTIDVVQLFAKQVNLIGVSNFGLAEFDAAIKFAADRRLEPVISRVYALEEWEQAFQAMRNQAQFGKLVLTV